MKIIRHTLVKYGPNSQKKYTYEILSTIGPKFHILCNYLNSNRNITTISHLARDLKVTYSYLHLYIKLLETGGYIKLIKNGRNTNIKVQPKIKNIAILNLSHIQSEFNRMAKLFKEKYGGECDEKRKLKS